MARADEPAFPQHVINPTAQSYGVASNTGMSIREWFAGQAMVGLFVQHGILCKPFKNTAEKCASFANVAFQIADAMIAQAEKK